MKSQINNRYTSKGYHEGSRLGQYTIIGVVVLAVAGAIGYFCIMYGWGI